MGLVYRGYDIRTKKDVAIKVLHEQFEGMPEVVARFRKETDVVNRVGHEGIAVILDRAQPDEAPVFIVMEFLDGKTLAQVLDENGQNGKPLHVQHVRYIGLKLLETLEAVHESGIIHRDLKPENVFVLGRMDKRYRVKIIDFGIAKFKEADPKLTQVGTVVGTPLYMSPEQCRGLPVDHRTDLYAIGCVLYEMATGRPPFVGDLSEVQQGHICSLPESPTDLNGEIPLALSAVIVRALAKEPANRFPDAEAMHEALDDAVPEDKLFWRDSRPPSPVNGSSAAKLAPRLLPRVPEQDPGDATPTRLVPEKAAQVEAAREALGRAETITPTGLRQEETGALSAKKAREVFDAAVDYLKMAEVWILQPSRRAGVIAVGVAVFVIVALTVLTALLSGNGTASKAADAGTTPDAAVIAEAPPPPAEAPDVLVIRVPVPMPTPSSRDAGADTSEDADAGEDKTRTEATEAEVANSSTPPTGYTELLAEGTAAFERRNYRAAARKFTGATELWREGPDAWRELGDTLLLLGRRSEAKTALREYLQLAPDAPDAAYYRGIVGNK
jgi:tRNA A-37 threonylcarbamoyl transferase component Bud32/tetratricopeptide (TPR) repeat protein